MNTYVLKSIQNDILELSDIARQRAYWLGNDPNHVSSYVELMSRLFDDNNFDQFVEIDTQTLGFSDAFRQDLKQLRELLNDYEEIDTDAEIIDDPKWESVREQARVVSDRWDAEVGQYS